MSSDHQSQVGLSEFTQGLGKAVRFLAHRGWLIAVATLILLALVGVITWKLAAIGAVLVVAITVSSPLMFGIIVALDGRRLKRRAEQGYS